MLSTLTFVLGAEGAAGGPLCPSDTPAWNGERCVLCANVGLKRAENGSCVEYCPRLKFARDKESGELNCVRECPHWWDREDAGFCDEQVWFWCAVGLGLLGLVVIVVNIVIIKKCFFTAGKGFWKAVAAPQGVQGPQRP